MSPTASWARPCQSSRSALGRGLPARLEHLVGVERHPGVEQPLRLDERGHRLQHQVLGDPLDPDRAAGERPAQRVPGPGVLRATLGVALPLDHRRAPRRVRPGLERLDRVRRPGDRDVRRGRAAR